MIKFILFMIFSFNICLASDWPNQMHSIKNINSSSFTGIKNYFEKLKTNYAYSYKKNEISFFTISNGIKNNILQIKMKSFDENGNDYNYLYFYKNNYLIERVLIKLTGNKSKLSLNEILEFNFFNNIYSTLSVQFLNLDFNIFYSNGDNNSKVFFRPYKGSNLEIHIIETYEKEKQISQLYYQCDGCNGDKVTAVMNFVSESNYSIRYYLYKEQIEVNPLQFYTQASGFLSGVKSSLDSLPERLIINQGFPLVD